MISKDSGPETDLKLFYKENGQINDEMKIKIQVVYYIFGALWLLFLLFYIQIIHNFELMGPIGVLILFLPLIIFTINLFNAKYITKETEGQYFGITYLSIALIIIVPFVNMTYYYGVLPDQKRRKEDLKFQNPTAEKICMDEKKVIEILIIALSLAVLSLMDIWVKPEWTLVVKHIRSSLQIIALSLIIYALFVFYQCNIKEKKKENS